MRRKFKQILISIFILIPLAISGITFSYTNLANKNDFTPTSSLAGVEQYNNKATDDSYYIEGANFAVYPPTPPTFDENEMMNISFLVEKASSKSWDDFEMSLRSFDIVFEERGALYRESELGRLSYQGYSLSPSAGPRFQDNFEIVSGSTGNVATYKLIEPIWLVDALPEVNWIQKEPYQVRFAWKDASMNPVEEQYTEPSMFNYAVELPSISISSYQGYEQAIVKVSTFISDEALAGFYGGSLSDIYESFKISWGTNVGVDIVEQLPDSDIALKDFIIDTNGGSTNWIDMYLLFGDLRDGDTISVNIDYSVNVSNYGVGYRDSINYDITFNSRKYDTPELLDIDEDEIEILDFTELDKPEDHQKYGDIIVPVQFLWTDLSFPPLWNNLSTAIPKAVFESEIEYKKIVDSITINSITNSSGDSIDPASVYFNDISYERGSNQWDISDAISPGGGDIIKTTYLNFKGLELGETYSLDFKIAYENNAMFQDVPATITNKVSFKVPETIDAPEIEITNITIPENLSSDGITIINEPNTWNSLNIEFSLIKPSTWSPIWSSQLSGENIFDKIEFNAYVEYEDENGNMVWDLENPLVLEYNQTMEFGNGRQMLFTGLNSDSEYGFEAQATINDTYARIFGFDTSEGAAVIKSDIVASSTREKYDPIELSSNALAHDQYEPEESPTEFTYAFYIDSPLSGQWDLINKDEEVANTDLVASAYYFENIIEDVYITDVYTENDMTSPDAEALYDERFYVDNVNQGEQNLTGTDVSTLKVDNVVNDTSNWNTITVSNLVTSFFYYGKLVIELTPEAYDASTGWMNTNGLNTISTDIILQPGRPINAPILTVESVTPYQSDYNRHSADIELKIDLNPLVPDFPATGEFATLDEYFQHILTRPGESVGINTNITVTQDGEVIGSPKVFDWATIINTTNYQDITKSYSYVYTVNDLEGNSEYRIDFENDEDLGYIEDVLDVSAMINTAPNKALTANDFSVSVVNYETGNQNESTNLYENITVDLTQIDTGALEDFHNRLSGNITSIDVVSTTGNVVATFDPADIPTLSNGVEGTDDSTTISAQLINPVAPGTVVDLSNYKLKVENDSYTESGFVAGLDTLSGTTTFTVGGLEAPTIQSINLNAYKNSIVADWNVTHMNNIEQATAYILEFVPDVSEPSGYKPNDYTSHVYSSFSTPDDSNWEESFTQTEFVAGNAYIAFIQIDSVVPGAEMPVEDFMASNAVIGPEAYNINFDLESVETSTDSIVANYRWDDNTSVIMDEFRFQLVDSYGETDILGNPKVIFEEIVQTNDAVSGTGSISINNNNLLSPDFEIISNQEYELIIEYTRKDDPTDDWQNISFIMGDPNDGDLLNPETKEKGKVLIDAINVTDTTEESFTFEYQFANREEESYANKVVTDHRIRLYTGNIVDESKLLLESDNLVNSVPGVDGKKSFTISNGDLDINGNDIEIHPTLDFTIESFVTYDTYEHNSRVHESETMTTETIIVPWNKTELVTTRTEFIDNDSVEIDFELVNVTAFRLDINSSMDVFIRNEKGEFIDFIYDGVKVEAVDGLTLTWTEIFDILTNKTGDDDWFTTDVGKFTLKLDGIPTSFGEKISLFASIDVANIDGTTTDVSITEDIVNNSDQTKVPFIDASNMGVLNRVEVLGGEKYYYELSVSSNYPINSFTDIVISDVNTPHSSSSDIEVLSGSMASIEFETYNENNLYLSVDGSLIDETMEFNDLRFLIGRYIGINATNLDPRVVGSWDDYDWFAIDSFQWIYPPKTPIEILVMILFWFFIILIVLIILGTVFGSSYYVFRITFSNKKWYPIVETIANEKFNKFTEYVGEYGWTQKFQEYFDLSEKNIHELRDYALKMNIPITFEMNRKELLKVVSLLTDEEIERFEQFSDDDIDVRNFEILDFWKVERYKSHHPWIKYKMGKLEEKEILTSDDDRLSSLQEQLDYIEKEKELQEEREKAFQEIQELVADVLDTNVELTTEFSVNPLEDFKKELQDKVAREEEIAEAERKAEEEAEAARIAEEEAKAKAEADALAAKNAKEIKEIKEKLKHEYDRIVINIAAFNQKAEQEVEGVDNARKVADDLNKERIKIKKLVDIFKARQDRITALGGRQKAYPFEPLANVDIKIALSKFEKVSQELEALTKQSLLARAEELKVDVKPSWNKERLVKDIVKQMKDRGDFDD